MISKKLMGQSYADIKLFNEIANNLTGNMVEQVNNQLSFIFSELEETIAAFESGDAVELVDGAADLWVTVAGLLQKLEAAGFNVGEAIKRVDANNLSKFVPIGSPLRYKEGHKAKLNKKHGRYVIKDANGKIMKPLDFVPVDLNDCVPANFFGAKE